MLHSFGPRFKPWSAYAETIRSEINRQSRKSVDFVDQSLVNARAGDAQSEAPFVEYLSALYAGHPLDLIIAFGAPAATFVQQHRQRLFPTVPMVITAVDHRRVQYEKLTENDTVVPIANNVPVVFENILQVLPSTKTIAVLVGASPIERFWTEELRRELAPLANRVQLKWYNDLPFDDILRDVEHLSPHSAIFSVLMNVDAAGVVHETGNALNKVASRANAPIFTYDNSYFDGAIVGGPMFSMLEGSRIAATVATRILDGEKAGDIKTPPIKYASPKFDWRQMQRWESARATSRRGAASISTAHRLGKLSLANCDGVRRGRVSRRAHHAASVGAAAASFGRNGLQAAGGGAGPCQSLLDRGRIVRIDCPRNQSTAGRNPDQYRNRPAHAPVTVTRPRRNEGDSCRYLA